MDRDIGYLHHVGHVVGDMVEALDRYRRLGFILAAPSYPAMAVAEGAEPTPFGAANTHAEFTRNFIELATSVRAGSRIPADANLIPLQAPAAMLPLLMERIGETSAHLAACLDRFEGLHIVMLQSPAIEAAADRLTQAGVSHGGVNTVQRPVETDDGLKLEQVSYLEIGDASQPGRSTVPEGRVGVAATRRHLLPIAEHPNGATDLTEVILCVAVGVFGTTVERYGTYLGASPVLRGSGRASFELDDAALTLTTEAGLAELLPGETPPALPAFAAYAVSVRDINQTRAYLESAGFPLHTTPAGTLFIPASAALGTAIIFQPLST